jgi:hypothetical protein
MPSDIQNAETIHFLAGLEEVVFWPEEYYHDRGNPGWQFVRGTPYASWNDVAERAVTELKLRFQELKDNDAKCANPRFVLRRTVLDKCPMFDCCYRTYA